MEENQELTERRDTKQTYIPMDDYEANDYKPFGPRKEHFCVTCKKYYAELYEKGITERPFMPYCKGCVADSMPSQEELGVDDETYGEMQVVNDPVKWAEAMFGWKPRFYQSELLGCSSLWKSVRAGRRTGKTTAIAVLALHYAATHDHHNILVIAPYQSQVSRVFEEMQKFIDESPELADSIERQSNSPPILTLFKNGSRITGFSSGKNTSQHANQIRGQDAHIIFLDEADLMNDADLDIITAIMVSHPECRIWASSTPIGWRKAFYRWARNKNLSFKEFHYIASESPNWTQRAENFFRTNLSKLGYIHEMLAEFGDEAIGVFKSADIDACLQSYSLEDELEESSLPRIMGVDWNAHAGTHITIVEYNGESYKLVHKTIVPKSEFTQNDGVLKVAELDRIWDPRFVYVDSGWGDTQVELMKLSGMNTPGSTLHKKVRPVSMGKTTTIRDPDTGLETKKGTKQFMVELACRCIEDHRGLLPASEDTDVKIEPNDVDNTAVGLVQQMRAFSVTRLSESGKPVYSQDYEHTLTAWMLAILGFQLEFGGWIRHKYSSRVAVGGQIGEKVENPQVLHQGEKVSAKELVKIVKSQNQKKKRPKRKARTRGFGFRRDVPEVDEHGLYRVGKERKDRGKVRRTPRKRASW